ncbi:MAG: hypothetical protein HDQ99_08785 [Lachnospiraceae bacterium]|nr:hypothetical protein [Lachnospiraceae bacterium]
MSGRGRKAIRAGAVRRGVILVSAFTILCMFGAWSSGSFSGLISGKERENRLYPSEAEAVEMAGMLPTVCTPVGECYQKKEGERGFSEELLADLQECVRSGGMSAAVEAYQDDTLLIDVDTLLSLCPDYESLIAEQAEKQKVGLQEKDIIDGIVSIYRVELDGEALLVEYRDLEVPWFLLKKTEGGYLAGNVHLSNYTITPSWEHCGRAMFAEGDGYCLLEWIQRDGEELLSLYYFTPQEGWLQNIGEVRLLFDWEIRYIRENAIKAVPSFFYLNHNHSLTPEVQAYVEENAMLLADRLVEDDVIWGDETSAAPIESNVEVIGETGERWEMYPYEWNDGVSQADYDNDGETELFWRKPYDSKNLLLTAAGGGYRAESISLYGADMPAVELWFVEFSGKTVTFEIVEPYGADCPLLAAYLVEGNKRIPLLTCQLIYGKTVEIDDNESANGNSFQVRQVMPLLAGQEKETVEQTAFQKKLTAWIREAGRDVVIEPLQAETPFPEDFLEFIEEGAAWCLSGKLFSAYAAPYEVNTEKDLEEFKEKYSVPGYLDYNMMAYRWEAADGTVNYLVSEGLDYINAVNTLYWYRDDGDGLYQKEPITDLSCDYGSYCGVLSYGGRLYCVTVAVNLWRQPLRIDLIPLGDAGEWEHYCLSFSYEEKMQEMLALEENTVLDAYVEEEAEAIYAACTTEPSPYQGRGEAGIIPKEIWRDIKNRDFSYSQRRSWYDSAHHDFKPVDVDNDGESEYAAVYISYGRYQDYIDYTIYGWRDETFTEFTMEGEGLLCCYEDRDNGYGITSELEQIWFEEIDGVTYLFTVEKLTLLDGFLMRARVIQDGKVQDAGAWLFRHTGVMLQDIQEMGEYESWMSA